jgi:hypothetical protein
MGRLLRFTRKGRKAAAEEPPAPPAPPDAPDPDWGTAGPSGTTRWDTGEPADAGWPGSGRPGSGSTDNGWPGTDATDTGRGGLRSVDPGRSGSGPAGSGRSGPGPAAAPGQSNDTDRWEQAASREHRGPTSLSEAPWRRNAPQRPPASAEDYWPTGEVGIHTPTTNGAAGTGDAAALGSGSATGGSGGAAPGSAGTASRNPVEGRSTVPHVEGRTPMRPPAEGRATPRRPADDLLPGGHPAETSPPGGLFGEAPPATRRPGDPPWPGSEPDEPLWSESDTSTHGAGRTATPRLPSPESDVPDRRAQWAALRDSMSTSDIGGPGPLPHYEPPAAWQKLLRSSRRERVRPGITLPVACTVLAGLAWLAAVGYGAWKLNLVWSLAALAAGLGGLVLAVRGRSMLGLLPVLAGAAAWGMATGGKVPDTFSDVAGDLRVVAWNVLYAVPLLAAYGCATWVDSKRYARDRVRGALGERRWCGAADVPDAEPTITALETIPSARFFALPDGSCAHLVVAGRRFALVRATVWPRGEYTATDLGEVHRNGRIFAHGSDDFNGVMADVRTWSERLEGVAPAGIGFLVVHPASERPGEVVTIDIPETRGVRVLPADQFVAVAGEFLAAEPYRVDVALNERLGEHLPIFAHQPQ